MKRFDSIMLVFAFILLVSCGKTNLPDSKDKSGAEYSNLVDSTSQSELRKTLLFGKAFVCQNLSVFDF